MTVEHARPLKWGRGRGDETLTRSCLDSHPLGHRRLSIGYFPGPPLSAPPADHSPELSEPMTDCCPATYSWTPFAASRLRCATLSPNPKHYPKHHPIKPVITRNIFPNRFASSRLV